MTINERDLRISASKPALSVRGTVARKRELGGRRPSRAWRIREDIPARWRAALMVASIALPLAAWVLLRATNTVQELFLPGPLDVLRAGKELALSGDLGADTLASVQRIALGFGLALLISVPLGLAIGTFKSVNAFFEPLIAFLRYMPATAFVPLLLIWLGLGEGPKVGLIVIGTVFFNTLMIANIVWSVPSELIRVSQTLGGGTFTVFRKVIFPFALPGMIDAARVNLAAAWNLIVVAELVAADQGLGFRIVRAQKFLHTDQIFAILIVIGLLGLTSDLGLRALRNRVAPWSQE
ncbi:MAG: ABC transporter permease [Dehalococcoidia bacterium]